MEGGLGVQPQEVTRPVSGVGPSGRRGDVDRGGRSTAGLQVMAVCRLYTVGAVWSPAISHLPACKKPAGALGGLWGGEGLGPGWLAWRCVCSEF